MKRAGWYLTVAALFVATFVATLAGHVEWVAIAFAAAVIAWAAIGVVQANRQFGALGTGWIAVIAASLALVAIAVIYAIFHLREVLGWPLAYVGIAALGCGIAWWLVKRAESESRATAASTDVHANRRQQQLIALAWLVLILGDAWLVAIVTPYISLLVLGAVAAWMLAWLPRRMRTRRAQIEIVVDCTPQQAFDFVSDARNVPRWVPECESSELITSPPIGAGSRFRQRVMVPEIRDPQLGTTPASMTEMDETIASFEPPRRVVLEIVGGNGSRDVVTFMPSGGSTTIHTENLFVYDVADAWLGVPLHPASQRLSEFVARAREGWYARLKEVLEAEPHRAQPSGLNL